MILVGHDWGASIAWYFCQLRPDKVKALVNMSVAYRPRHPKVKPVDGMRALFGDDFYICRFQLTLGSRDHLPPCIPKEIGFRGIPVPPLPSWLSEDDINYFASKFNYKGFTGPLNYYRALNLEDNLIFVVETGN
ncbi:bifunctional epoxide hydrolase 2-like isoform X2 [Hibiscus syriacus]|uniref:Bifunctional epoxide hydrolase 2-like isoform X2 n=1 Tax=Hibiscus syriacus TaxID=106335 RepID=A0A6A2YDE7_HIBSY|nr:bifunctional epoxide hydrolase 2-like isoform X2 [Hibiscus syriacus]